MRIFGKVSILALLFTVCPGLVHATIYKIEDYNKGRFTYSNNRINCTDFSWDTLSCTNRGGILSSPRMCSGRGLASNECRCPNDYIEIEAPSDITLNTNFNYNNRTIITLTDKDNNTKYCVPEPRSCSDSSYVMESVLESYTNRSFNIALQNEENRDILSITKSLGGTNYTISNNERSPIHKFEVGNMTYYCAPNNANSYTLSYQQPSEVGGSSSAHHVSLSEISTAGTHAAQSEIDVGGSLNSLKLYYLSGCQSGWNLYSEEPTCPNETTVNAGHSFTYINSGGSSNSGYCGRCTGCAAGYNETTHTLYGNLDGSNTVELQHNSTINTDAFIDGTSDCSIRCNTDDGYIQIYSGVSEGQYSYAINGDPCIGRSTCLGSSTATDNHYIYSYSTITKTIEGMSPHILVCAKPIGCNVEGGYVGGCQYNCWKSFFSTRPNVDINLLPAGGSTPDNG